VADPVVLGAGDVTARPVASGVIVTELLGDAHGCRGLHQRRLALDAGARVDGVANGNGEAWFVLRGRGQLRPESAVLAEGTAVWLAPGASYSVMGEPTLELLATTVAGGNAQDGPDVQVVRLNDCAVEYTGDREFRVLLSEGLTVTQFAGYIPPGRAKAHHHTYDEVVHVLSGHGVVHLASGDTEIAPGTCIYLPPLQEHCLENTGTEPLRVLGVFHPAGSPAAKREA
jgi:mannose-6-phosphate isomerase-like protein (cupin superfamily)